MTEDRAAISFGTSFAGSDTFRALFREGMELVERSAAYLDGDGRGEARALARVDALAYASESMRLTTRLMQLASWLLLQRAVNEGDMSPQQAASEKHKIKLSRQGLASTPDVFARLPERLQDLASASLRLQARVIHLDSMMRDQPAAATRPTLHPVEAQIDRLRRAFGAKE